MSQEKYIRSLFESICIEPKYGAPDSAVGRPLDRIFTCA